MGGESPSQLGLRFKYSSAVMSGTQRALPCLQQKLMKYDISGGVNVHALRTGRLREGASFLVALWMAALVSVGCGGGNPADDQAAASAAERARDDNSSAAPGSHKVTLCHIPPGNPANAHTITVGEPAVRAHLAHGDYLGPCHGSTDDGSDPNGGTPNPNPNDGSTCVELGSSCGPGLPACCTGLFCLTGQCAPRLN